MAKKPTKTGRPPNGRKRYHIMLNPEIVAEVDRQHEAKGLPRGQVIEIALKRWLFNIKRRAGGTSQ